MRHFLSIYGFVKVNGSKLLPPTAIFRQSIDLDVPLRCYGTVCTDGLGLPWPGPLSHRLQKHIPTAAPLNAAAGANLGILQPYEYDRMRLPLAGSECRKYDGQPTEAVGQPGGLGEMEKHNHQALHWGKSSFKGCYGYYGTATRFLCHVSETHPH